jgi:hypothetical protein
MGSGMGLSHDHVKWLTPSSSFSTNGIESSNSTTYLPTYLPSSVVQREIRLRYGAPDLEVPGSITGATGFSEK